MLTTSQRLVSDDFTDGANSTAWPAGFGWDGEFGGDWYTDGLTEGLGKDGQEYGEKRLRRSIASVADKRPDEILEKVIRDAEAWFADFTHPEDDITLVVGKFPEKPRARRPAPPV